MGFARTLPHSRRKDRTRRASLRCLCPPSTLPGPRPGSWVLPTDVHSSLDDAGLRALQSAYPVGPWACLWYQEVRLAESGEGRAFWVWGSRTGQEDIVSNEKSPSKNKNHVSSEIGSIKVLIPSVEDPSLGVSSFLRPLSQMYHHTSLTPQDQIQRWRIIIVSADTRSRSH